MRRAKKTASLLRPLAAMLGSMLLHSTLRHCRALYDCLYPPRCAFCGSGTRAVCTPCCDDLRWNVPACRVCARPLASDEVCASCLHHPPPWTDAYVPLRYAFPLDVAIKRFKFHAALHYLPVFAELLRPTLASLPTDLRLIQPMPLHWRRHGWRGFNQARELATLVAHALSLPVVELVKRTQYTAPQSSLTGKDRDRDLTSCFRVRRPVPPVHILIVDDVLTTGATAAALSRCLLHSGAKKVSVLTLARSSTD